MAFFSHKRPVYLSPFNKTRRRGPGACVSGKNLNEMSDSPLASPANTGVIKKITALGALSPLQIVCLVLCSGKRYTTNNATFEEAAKMSAIS